jgi:hypothetical protein
MVCVYVSSLLRNIQKQKKKKKKKMLKQPFLIGALGEDIDTLESMPLEEDVLMCDLDRDKFMRVPSEDVGEDLDDRPLTQPVNTSSSSSASITSASSSSAPATSTSSTTPTTTTTNVVMNNINVADNDDTNWRKMTPLASLRSRLQALAKTIGNKSTDCLFVFFVDHVADLVQAAEHLMHSIELLR